MPETSTRYVGWCPICGRDIKVRDNHLVHHGYQRPGIGHILGDCPGVGYPPYEISTRACDAYRHRLIEAIRNANEYIARLQQDPPDLRLTFDDYDPVKRRVRRSRPGGPALTVTITRDQADALEAQLPGYDKGRYSWDERRTWVIDREQARLGELDRSLRRMDELIAEWPGPRPLRTIEEEINRQEQSRAEREQAKTALRDAKIAAEVAKIQKRIDSAVRNKNSATLADIYTSDKLRTMSGYRLTQEEAIALLDRDHIWRAFGLPENQKIIGTMREGIWVPKPDGGFDVKPMPWPAELGGGFAKTRGW